MVDVNSIARRIGRLKSLAKEYFLLNDGAAIEKHLEVIRVFDIRGSIHSKHHPHHRARIYISRKSLKHFVERRRNELEKDHSLPIALDMICQAIDDIRDTITNFTTYTYEPADRRAKHFYFKDRSNQERPGLRILLESIDDRLEICSIHFTKNRKAAEKTTD